MNRKNPTANFSDPLAGIIAIVAGAKDLILFNRSVKEQLHTSTRTWLEFVRL